MFSVMSGEQLFEHLYLNLPSTDMWKSGFQNAFDSYLHYTTLWSEISNAEAEFDAENSKQVEVQAETELKESKALEESMNGLGEDK